jgi:cyclophilin family peptidyl-prolyl cis-trans isomerase
VGTSKRSRQKANRAAGRAEAQRTQARNKTRKRVIQFGVGIPALVVVLFLFVQLVVEDDSPSTNTTVVDNTETTVQSREGDAITGQTPCPATDGSQDRAASFENAPPICIDPTKNYTALFTTSEGVVEVELDTANVPNTVNNFVVLSRYKYYDDSLLFRTDTSIDIIQGGGRSNTDSPGYTIADEGDGYTYEEGDLVMARTSAPNSAGAQFFFATGPKVSLLNDQGTYVKFGKVVSGKDVLQKIMAMHNGPENGSGAPDPIVTVQSVVITER